MEASVVVLEVEGRGTFNVFVVEQAAQLLGNIDRETVVRLRDALNEALKEGTA